MTTVRLPEPQQVVHLPGATFHDTPPTHLTVDGLEAVGVRHAFTTRHHGSFAGVSGAGPFVGASTGPALRALGIDGHAVRYARQVHGAACLVADAAPPGLVGEGDALVTTAPRVPLAIFTADCLALVLVDPERRALAVAHVGWRGTVAALPGRLVETLGRHVGVRPERLQVAIGPSIGPCCYEVDGPVVEPLRAAFPRDWARWTYPRGPGKWWLDLWQASTDQLTAAGVRPEAIVNPRLCTSCRHDLFFSYRREGKGVRLAAIALLDV
ncbi:MAG: laccase domain-containing protein [Candidatus Rokubacteria bacterium]|nr:laccase domain-containing protein [Candidatus Rokubacteria bacterium]